MTSDPELHIRTPLPWRTAAIINALSPAVARYELLWSLQPPAAERTTIAREHLRQLLGLPSQVHTRIAERDAEIIAAAWWTTCTPTRQLTADLIIPGSARRPELAAALHARLAGHHPRQSHDHLLLEACRD